MVFYQQLLCTGYGRAVERKKSLYWNLKMANKDNNTGNKTLFIQCTMCECRLKS